MVRRLFCVALALFAAPATAADFGTPADRSHANIDAIGDVCARIRTTWNSSISFGTSKGGSAGHLALGVRDGVPDDDLVYSANFYADRSEEHALRLLHRRT